MVDSERVGHDHRGGRTRGQEAIGFVELEVRQRDPPVVRRWKRPILSVVRPVDEIQHPVFGLVRMALHDETRREVVTEARSDIEEGPSRAWSCRLARLLRAVGQGLRGAVELRARWDGYVC